MLSTAQLAMRRTGIGGSDVGAILGLDQYRKPIDVWLSATGRAEPFTGNRHTHWGNRLERVMADEYAERTGLHLRESETMRAPTRPWQIGTPDRLAYESSRHRTPLLGLECKARDTRAAHLWGEDGTADVPESVACQAHWYMSLTNLAHWDVIVLIGGNDCRVYRLARDLELEADLLETVERFWIDHIEADKPPPVDGSSSYDAFLRRRFATHRPDITKADGDAERLAAMLRAARADLAQAERAERELVQHIAALAGDASGIDGEGWRFRWQERRGSIDWQAIARHLGVTDEWAEQHRRAGSRSAVFRDIKPDNKETER